MLLAVFGLDLFAGGGGRFIQWNGISLRYALFFFQFFFLFYCFSLGLKFSGYVYKSTIAFLCFVSFFVLIGQLNGYSLSKALFDIKPLLFFLWLPSLYLLIRSEDHVIKIFKLLYFSAFFVATIHVLFSFLIYVNLVSFASIYESFLYSKEFVWRGNNFFFYKGVVYTSIAFIMVLSLHKTINFPFLRLFIVIALASILMTFTKGVILATLIMTIFVLLLNKKYMLIFLMLVLMSIALYYILLYRQSLAGSEESLNVRLRDIYFIVDNTDALKLFFGHGFGWTINNRQNIENSLLWFFSHSGLVGVIISTLPYIYVAIKSSMFRQEVRAYRIFLLASLGFMYLISLTNPFINNPLGLGWLLLCLVCANVFSKKSLP